MFGFNCVEGDILIKEDLLCLEERQIGNLHKA